MRIIAIGIEKRSNKAYNSGHGILSAGGELARKIATAAVNNCQTTS